MSCDVRGFVKACINICLCSLFFFIPLNSCFEFKFVTPINGPTSGGVLITAWGGLVSSDSWNECNSVGASFGVEDSTLSATFYPSLFFANKVSGVTQTQWLTFAKECSIPGNYSVFILPALPSGEYSGALWYAVKKNILLPRGMQDALSLPFSYDLPVIVKLNISQPALVGGSLTIIGNNFRTSSVPFSVAVGATSCFDISFVHPHTAFKCTMKPFFNAPSSRLNVSVIFDTNIAYVWRGFSFGDVRGILTPTPLDLQKSLSGASVIYPFTSQSLGMRSTSLFASIHSTSCTFSSWLSDTSLICKQSSGLFPRTNSSLRVSIASAGMYRYQATFFTQNPSCQFLQLLQARNGSFRSSTGSSYISFLSGGLGTCDKSVKNRVGTTSCGSSVWVSDSEVAAKTFPSRKVSTIVVLSVSNFVSLCPEALNVSLKPDAGIVSTLRSAMSGPIVVLVDGINMGHRNACSKLRVASSASSVTSWTSDSSMAGKMSTRAASLVPSVLLSISNSISNFNSTFAQMLLSSHVGLNRSSHLLSDFPTTGTLFLSLTLSSAGTIDASSCISRGVSASLASLWKSESSIICKSGSEHLPASSLTMSIQASKVDLKTSVSFLLAITNPNTSKHFEVASSGSGMIALQCQNLGVWSFSRNVRIHQSACQFSSWISESTIICKPHLASSFFGAILISSDGKLPSGHATNSWRFHITGNATNTPFTGSSKLTMFGAGLLSHDLSARARLAGTASDFTSWRSFTNVIAKVPRGKGFFAIAISLQIHRYQDSIYNYVFDFEDFSFAPFSYMHNTSSGYPSTGGIEINLIGKSASNEDVSGSVRLSATAYLFSKWISWTSLMCKTGQGDPGSTPSTLVSYGLEVDTQVANLPLPKIEVFLKGSTSNLPSTGSRILQTLGASFQNFDTSLAMQVSRTGQQSTSWMSHSSITALSPCIFGRRSLFVLASVAGRHSALLNVSAAPFFTNYSVLSTRTTATQNALPPTSGAANIVFFGTGMGVYLASSAARVRLSACNILRWTSESAIVCKMAAGSGANNSLFISQNSVAVKFLTSSFVRTAFAAPSISAFSNIDESPYILVHGSNFVTFNSDVSDIVGFESRDGAFIIEPQQTRILLTHDALLQGKTVKDIEIRMQLKASRFDDVIVSLETSPFVGRIILLKSQCFGCVKTGSDGGLDLIFSDGALIQPPASDCLSGIFLPSTPFNSLFAYSGRIFLAVSSGASRITCLSSSIKIVQSNVNIVANKAFPSFEIKWYSDSALAFRIPAIIGKNHSFEAIIDGQNSSTKTGLSYPFPVVQLQARRQSIPTTGSSIFMILGSFFGETSSTLRLKIGASSCLNSIWASDAAVYCKSAPGLSIPNLLGATVTVARQLSKSKMLIVEHESSSLASAIARQNVSSTGNFFINILGSRFGISQFSSKLRISMSSPSSTLWSSDSSVNSLVVTIWKLVAHLILSVASLSTQANVSFNSTQNVQITLADICFPRSGSSQIVILGSGFSTRHLSLQVRIRESSTCAALWISDSCIYSKNSRFGVSSTAGVTVTLPNWKFTAIASDNNILISEPSTEFYGTYAFQNRSISLSTSSSWQSYSVLTVQGQNFGFFESSVFNSLSIDPDIRCDSVQWISDTSLSAACEVSPPPSEVVFRMSQSSGNVQTFPARFLSSVNTAGIIGNLAFSLNLPTTGNVVLLLSGKDFSSVYGTVSRISSTTCLNSIWHSASSVSCRVPSGVGLGLPFAVSSLKKISQSKSEFVDHAHPIIRTFIAHMLPASGSFAIILNSSGLGTVDHSSRLRLAVSSILTHSWFSDSAISLKISNLMMMPGVNFVASLDLKCAAFFSPQLSEAPPLFLNATREKALASSGTSFVVILAERLGTFGISPNCRIALSSCLVSRWISDSLVKCKISHGVGVVDLITVSGSARQSPAVQQLMSNQTVYMESVLQEFNSSGSSILFEGKNFGQASPYDRTVSKKLSVQVSPNTESVILSSSALTEGRAIVSIAISVVMKQISRLDDIVLILEVFQSESHTTVTQIVLFRDQCFGCLFDQGTSIILDFTDDAVSPVPLSGCTSVGLYKPKYLSFESIYGFTGMMRLKATSGSNAITFEMVSITVSRSRINFFFSRKLDNKASELVASKLVSWTSDSALSSIFPAVVGRNHSIQGIMYNRGSNFLSGFAYPNAQFSILAQLFPSSGTSIVSFAGRFFGQMDATSRMRTGASSCPSTTWISDVAVICRGIAAGQSYKQVTLQTTVAETVGDAGSLSHYDFNFHFQSRIIQPSSGSLSLSMVLIGLGVSDPTIKSRLMSSSSISTLWISNSAVHSIMPFHYGSRSVFASIGRQVMTIPFDFAENLLIEPQKLGNLFLRTASNWITVTGNGLGFFGASATARTLNSNCPASNWISDSSLICRIPQAFLTGARDLSISAGHRSIQYGFLNDIYGDFSPSQSSTFDLLPFYPANISISSLEQLKFSSIGSNFGFATGMKVGSTYCREMLWSSQSSVACSIQCFIPYYEPFLMVRLENSIDASAAITSNDKFVPVKYSLASSMLTSISVPPAPMFGASSWGVEFFKTFQKFDFSLHFLNNNSEPYMHFFVDESGIQRFKRVPIFITIKIEIEHLEKSEISNILCEDTQFLKTTILAGERNAFVSFSDSFCAPMEKVRFTFTICSTSDEELSALFSAGKNDNIPRSNMTQSIIQSPWFSVSFFSPFFAIDPISSVPLIITAGVVQSLTPTFEIKTKTFCSDTVTFLNIDMICSQRSVKFSYGNSSFKFEHQAILKYSCFFVMPIWYSLTADSACQLRVTIPSSNLNAFSSSFMVVPTYVSHIKSAALLRNTYSSGDTIVNRQQTLCYIAFVYDKFDNLINDASKTVEISAIYTHEARNISYTLNGTLQTNPKSDGVVQWCSIQVTRLVTLAHLTIRVFPVSVFDSNTTFIFQSFSVLNTGFAAQIFIASSNVSLNGTIFAHDFQIPPISFAIADSFGNILKYDSRLLMRVSIQKRSKTRELLSEQYVSHQDHLHSSSVIEAAQADGCIDYNNFTMFPVVRPNSNDLNTSTVSLTNVRVCEQGLYDFRMELIYNSDSSEFSMFSSLSLSSSSFIYEVIPGAPTKIHLTAASVDAPTVIRSYSFFDDRIFVEILDNGFNLVLGSATLSLKTLEETFQISPASIQVTGDRILLKYIWLSGYRDLTRQNIQQSLLVSTSSLNIVPSIPQITVIASCSPGSHVDGMQNLPSSLICSPCAPGSVSTGWDFKICHPCIPGTFAAQDARSCIACPIGYATNTFGSSSCRKCSESYFSSSNGTECVSFIFSENPGFNIIPFVSTSIPAFQMYDEISQQPRHSVKVQVKLTCLKRFNCTNMISNDDGFEIFSRFIPILPGQPASQLSIFSVEALCSRQFLGSNFRWKFRMEANDIYPSIDVFDKTNILINKCQPSIETIDPPSPKPKAVFGITLTETITIVGVDFAFQDSVLRLIPGFPILPPQICMFSCLQTGTQEIITSSSTMVQNLALIDTFECRTNFSFGMRIGDSITVGVSLVDGRRSSNNVKLHIFCPVLYYLSESDFAHGCEKCPYPQSLTRDANKPSIEDCVCNQGFYGRFGLDCRPCPIDHPGFECTNFGSRWPQIKAGFYIEYSKLPACVSNDVCDAITACLYPWACPGDDELSCLGDIGADTCYEGRGCYKCCSRYYMDDENMCKQCAPIEVSYATLIGAIFAPFILAAIAQAAMTPARKITMQGILDIVSFFQSVSNVSVVQIPWPNFVGDIFGFLKFFSFGLSAVKEECSLYMEPVTKLFFMAALPFALATSMLGMEIYKVFRSLREICNEVDKLPRKHTFSSIQRHNNIPDLIKCLLMDAFSLHPGFAPNSYFTALSVSVKQRSDTIIKMSVMSNITSTKFVMNLKKTHKYGHRGLLTKTKDYQEIAKLMKDSGLQDRFMMNSSNIRKTVSMILGIFVITLQGTLSALLGTFRCTPLNDKLVLMSNPEIVCDISIDPTYQSMMIVSILGCLWCGFLTPILIYAVLRSRWCRLFALRNFECYQEMFDSIVADVTSTKYSFIPGTMVLTSLTLCNVIFTNVPAQQLLLQIVFNFLELTRLLLSRPYLVKKTNDIEQVNSMANFVVIMSGLLYIARTKGELALDGSSRDVLGMFVVAVLMISTFILVSSVAIDVVSNLLLESRASQVSYWWKAFVVFLDESVLKQVSGFFFGLQMAQFSALTAQSLKETKKSQLRALDEKLMAVEENLNNQYLQTENSYFRSPLLMKILRDMAIKKAHRRQDAENSAFTGSAADFKNIEKLPEIQSVGSIQQILFNKHPERVNEKDPPLDFKSFSLNAMKVLDCFASTSVQPILLAQLVLAEEGVQSLDTDSVEFSDFTTTKFKKMQQLILHTSKTMLASTDINEAPVKKWPLLFRPAQNILFEWNMGVGIMQHQMNHATSVSENRALSSLISIFQAKQSISRKKISMIDIGIHESEFQDDNSEILAVEKPKWGTLRGQLLTNAQAVAKFSLSAAASVTKSSMPDKPTPRANSLKNVIATSRKTTIIKPTQKGGFKIRDIDNRLTNVPVSNEWIIEYSVLKRQWQMKHLEDRGQDRYVAYLDTNLVLSGCRNVLEWHVWNGDPHNRTYSIQTAVSLDVVTPGKPDAKSVRLKGFFARLIASKEGETVFWQFASNLNGEYSNLGLTSNNRFVYFNSFAAETYLAAEKMKDLEIQASRFGHAFVSSQASVVVGRRVITNKRFINTAVNQRPPLNAQSSPSASAVQVSSEPEVVFVDDLNKESANARSASEIRSDIEVDEKIIEGDEWSESSDAT